MSPGCHLDATRQTAGNDIADGGEGSTEEIRIFPISDPLAQRASPRSARPHGGRRD